MATAVIRLLAYVAVEEETSEELLEKIKKELPDKIRSINGVSFIDPDLDCQVL